MLAVEQVGHDCHITPRGVLTKANAKMYRLARCSFSLKICSAVSSNGSPGIGTWSTWSSTGKPIAQSNLQWKPSWTALDPDAFQAMSKPGTAGTSDQFAVAVHNCVDAPIRIKPGLDETLEKAIDAAKYLPPRLGMINREKQSNCFICQH